MSINETEFKNIAESTNIELLPLHNRRSTQSPNPYANGLDPDRTSSNHIKTESATPQLPIADRPQFLLLVILYLLQGIPVGLAFGSIPFLLKSHLSYSQVAFFSLASYPYSLKLIWSPIVDALFWTKLGRRKSWVVPVQSVSGIVLCYLGTVMDQLIENPEENLNKITLGFFSLVMLCATQDIAVDGWALTILSEQGLSYASTAQTVGLNTGYFLSFTVFLAFNSSGFSNKYLRSTSQENGVLSLNSYLKFWGIMYLLVTIYVFHKVQEDPRRKDRSASSENSGYNALLGVYKTMFQVLRLPAIKSFIILHLISKIGFLVNESATNLKLLEKGFAREDLAITVLIDFPFEIIFGYYVAKWSTGKNSLTPWFYAYLGRLFAAVLAQVVVYMFPKSGEVTKTYFIFVILHHLLGSFMSTIQFVSICAFHTQISDPLIGGTYMTLLNTISNLGGQWPKFLILNMIDFFTIKECDELDQCTTIRDGYYITNWICITLSIVLFFTWIKRKVEVLQRLPKSAWRVKEPS